MDDRFTSHVVAGAPDSKIVFPFFGFPGILLSYYDDWPDCIGGFSSTTCCCLNLQCALCKPTSRPQSCGICLTRELELLTFNTKAKSMTQFLCIDFKIAFPPDESTPYICTLCFLTLAYKGRPNGAFFKKLQDLDQYQQIGGQSS